jgi:hypothetical protein
MSARSSLQPILAARRPIPGGSGDRSGAASGDRSGAVRVTDQAPPGRPIRRRPGDRSGAAWATDQGFDTIGPTQATTRSARMTMGAGFHWLWPTPIGLHRYPKAASLNPVLVRLFGEGRAAQEKQRGQERGPFFASDDDLLDRVKLDEWQDLVGFFVNSLVATAREANQEAWGGQAFDLNVGIQGMWFQCSSQGAFHDVHTHGNCSWSAVYVVQIDEPEKRVTHPVYGSANGVTRLYGPPFNALGGAFVDVANAYLQPPSHDVDPVPGQLLLFPSWLAHQALPYGGDQERIIISFNATIHGSEGDQMHDYSPT